MKCSPGVLVVDDDPAICELIQTILEPHGYRVWVAHDGFEALRVFAENAPELRLLISDVLMPNMSGPALGESLVRRKPDLSVLFVSGYLGEYRRRLPQASTLAKPFDGADLVKLVTALVPPAQQRPCES